MHRVPCVLLVVLGGAGCLVVPEGARPAVAVDAALASEFNFRGMTNVEAPVLQTETAVDLPTKTESGNLSLRAFANWDLENSTGDAWFPDGHAGEPSEIDLAVVYSRSYRGYGVAAGLVSYALQNGDDFVRAPNGERGETKELFVSASRTVAWDLVPSLAIHHDFDEAEGWYVQAALARDFPVDEDFVIDSRVSLGIVDDDEADWIYGVDDGGFADFQVRAGVLYFLDANTTIRLGLNFSSIVDSDISGWLDVIDVDNDTFWADLGVTWAY